jgi:uncharacterized FlaG/YvyC family protein
MSAERDAIASVGAPESAGLGWSGARGGQPQRRRRDPSAPASDSEPADAPAQPAPIGQSLERINARLAAIGHTLRLQVTPETGAIVATVTDNATGTVLEQIPSHDLLHLAALLQRWAQGESALVDTTA